MVDGGIDFSSVELPPPPLFTPLSLYRTDEGGISTTAGDRNKREQLHSLTAYLIGVPVVGHGWTPPLILCMKLTAVALIHTS